jgi:hypothetical protein
MAATKRSSKASRSTTIPSSSLQVLNKIKWININNGGQLRKHEFAESGAGLLRVATEQDIKPNETYYMIDALKPNHFNETSFHPDVSWETILEFVNAKKIYIKNEKPNTNSTGESSLDRDTGPVQSSLF